MVDDYLARVQPATDPLDGFSNELIAQLDVDGGNGFSWWAGQSDWKTLTLISDYLIQSVRGTSKALTAASLSATELSHLRFSRQAKVSGALSVLDRDPTATVDDYIRAFTDNAIGRKAELKAEMAEEHTLYHLAQTLDRLAIVLIIVGGFQLKNVVKSDWSTLDSLKFELDDAISPNRPRVEPAGSAARKLQSKLLAPLDDLDKYGPPDWLPWLRESRNALTHRAPGTNWTILASKRRLVRPLYQQPKWSDVQTHVYADNPGPNGALIQEDSEVTLDGLCASVTHFVTDLTQAARECWTARQSDPSLIVQHGTQWADREPTNERLKFRGYGDGKIIKLSKGTDVRVNPSEARRLQAARLHDSGRQLWLS
ncbi:hypothetical protein GCM10023094_09250 [Rhodococcus olei]|uniref:Apea-like HEPN domain-containing protein n=1 Tax=Rhodococcus olei TaxID=2161675 RepID=A0ABP8NXX4_9NOCA